MVKVIRQDRRKYLRAIPPCGKIRERIKKLIAAGKQRRMLLRAVEEIEAVVSDGNDFNLGDAIEAT